MSDQSVLITYGDGSTQPMDVAITATEHPPAQPAFGKHTVKIGNTVAEQAVLVLTPGAVVAPTPPPPPPTDAPNIDPADLAAWGFTNVTRIDPGDVVMLNPSHWRMSSAHSQANGDATRNVDALASFGQSFYGGATDAFLHTSIASGQGVWMVGDTMPSGKWIVEFCRSTVGRDAFHAYGWGSGWVLGPQGQELDVFEDVNWGTPAQGYASSTYRSSAGNVVGSYYNAAFPGADGKPHTWTLAWDAVNAKQYLVWDRAQQGHEMAIANPTEPMTLQISTGYVSGTTPPSWELADNVYQWVRYYKAT